MLVCSLFLCSPLVSAAATIAAPGISIAGIHSPSFNAQGAQLICSVRVANPNDVPLSVTGADVRLQLARVHAADGRLAKPVIIPARGTLDVDLLVDLPMSSAFEWLPLFMSSDEFTVPFEVEGYVDVQHSELGRVPFRESGHVSMTSDGLVVNPGS